MKKPSKVVMTKLDISMSLLEALEGENASPLVMKNISIVYQLITDIVINLTEKKEDKKCSTK